MTNSILQEIEIASKKLSQKIKAHYESLSIEEQINHLKTSLDETEARSVKIMEIACEENNYKLFKINLAEYMADGYALAVKFNAGKEAGELTHLIFKNEDHLKAYWNSQKNCEFNHRLKMAIESLKLAIDHLSPRVA